MPDFIAESALVDGGYVLAVIMMLSAFMWVLILDRYWFVSRGVTELRDRLLQQWQQSRSGNRLVNQRLRAGLIAAYRQQLSSSVATIAVITAILPLLGLLGTVSGMIKTFEVMTVFGTGNVRGMADGISEALLTTMAGLLTALSGMYFASNLESRIDTETQCLAELMGQDVGVGKQGNYSREETSP
ncbi:MAG: MotA/TolQ/ExbB proton channel family protein [Pseudomonadales bacterium]|nr:MotA/TolQ/ExbB proton channel family protein [Pseudomonadales bacterium]